MDTKQVLDFLKQITDQLGPLSQHVLNVVSARVFAESLLNTIIGAVGLIIGSVVVILGKKAYSKTTYDRDKEPIVWITGFFSIIAFVLGAIWLYIGALDLLSIEYATIQRVITLVK